MIVEDTVFTADDESLEPASRKDEEPIENKEALEMEADPADFSEEDDNPTNIAINKQALLEWLTVADFT